MMELNFTKEQNENLQKEAKKIFDSMLEEQSIQQILAKIYVDNLEDKTEKQGLIMSEALIRAIKDFDKDYKAATEDLESFIEKFQDEVDTERNCEEQCEYWMKLAAGISAATAIMSEEVSSEQILQEIKALELTEKEATPEKAKELRELAKEVIQNSGIMFYALQQKADALKEMTSAEEMADMLISLEDKEVEYRAIVAMIAYTKIKNCEFENIPVEMTMEEVAVLVCAEFEQNRIMEDVNKGNIAVDIATDFLYVLGAVVLVKLLLVILKSGSVFVVKILGGVLAIPAFLVLGTIICRIMDKALTDWKEDSGKIVSGVAIAVEGIVSGIGTLMSFVSGKVLPQIVNVATTIFKKICTYEKEENVYEEQYELQKI